MTTLVRLLNMFDRFYFLKHLYTDCEGNICDAVCHNLSDTSRDRGRIPGINVYCV